MQISISVEGVGEGEDLPWKRLSETELELDDRVSCAWKILTTAAATPHLRARSFTGAFLRGTPRLHGHTACDGQIQNRDLSSGSLEEAYYARGRGKV